MVRKIRIVMKLMTFFLIAFLLTTDFTLTVMAAPTPASGNIQDRINQLLKIFPHNSYFTDDGKACTTHTTFGECKNCRLTYVMENRLGYSSNVTNGFADGYTCVAFARYAYYYIFGIKITFGNPGTTPVKNSGENIKPGDYVETATHTGIALWYEGDYVVLYDSNYGTNIGNQVHYATTKISKSSVERYLRADNYNEIDSSPRSGSDPFGCLDSVTGGDGTIKIRGWAVDNDSVGKAVEIHVYIGGPAGSSTAELHGWIMANVSRVDVNTVHPGVGDNHGFETTIQTEKRGSQPVYVYAINVPGTPGGNVLLGSGTVTISNPIPKVATPFFSLSTGQDVINGKFFYTHCNTDGATIYYTTDGSTPTSFSKSIAPSAYIPLTSAGTFRIKAIAKKSGMVDSEILDSGPVTINAVAAPVISVTDVAGGKSVSITCSTSETSIKYSTNGSDPQSLTHGKSYSGAFVITTPGVYTIKAQAVHVGMAYSPVVSSNSFTIYDDYTVTYNANGGTGAPAAQIKKHGVNLTLSSNIPKKEGFVFLGWAESSSATEEKYLPGNQFTKDANTTLYAVWGIEIVTEKTYQIVYNATGGAGAPDPQIKVHGVNLMLSSSAPSREGYAFLGWSENSGATVEYQLNGLFTKDADTTLYAVWDAIAQTYELRYDANGGKESPAAQRKTQGVSLTLSLDVPSREGYTFLGWSENAGADATQYQPGGQFIKDANATLYAVWMNQEIEEPNIPPVEPPTTPSDDQNIFSTEGRLNGIKLTATLTTIGICFDWKPADNALGYRIYRSTTLGGEGISISDFPLTGSSFFDANVSKDTQYYYSIARVEAEASFDQKTITLTPEQVGPRGEELAIQTTPKKMDDPNITPGEKRGFIMMTIGNPHMVVNEETVEIDPGRGTAPLITNGRTMVPIRAIVEAMSGIAGWDEVERRILLDCNGHQVFMWLDKTDVIADGVQGEMDISPYVSNGRTLLPVRFVAESIGCQIEWIGSVQRVIIVYSMGD